MERRRDVPYNSVRVWRGFKGQGLSWQQFCQKLGGVFIPTTPQIQEPLGLSAYLPTVLPEEKPACLPDEVALVFYSSQDDYRKTFSTTAGRAYGFLHSAAFDFSCRRSHSGFPAAFTGELMPDKPYALFTNSCNWQEGRSGFYAGLRKGDIDAETFLRLFGTLINSFIEGIDITVDSAYFIITEEYLLYWEHRPEPYAFETGGWARAFCDITSPVLIKDFTSVTLPASLHDAHQGLEIHGGECLNIKLEKQAVALSRKEDDMKIDRIGVYGRNGNSHVAPADTIVSYWSALGAGGDGFWAEVRLTARERLVCQPSGVYDRLKFQSTVLDEAYQPTGEVGQDFPWEKHCPNHPELDEVLRIFGRRADILLSVPVNEPRTQQLDLAERCLSHLLSFGLASRVIMTGGKEVCEYLQSSCPDITVAINPAGLDIRNACQEAKKIGAGLILVSPRQVQEDASGYIAASGLQTLVLVDDFSLSPTEFSRLRKLVPITGIIARSVERTVALIEPPALVMSDDFSGSRINSHIWSCGYSHANRDTTISQDDGLIFAITEGGEYSGGGAVTRISIHGRFDAQVDFQVDNPQRATTFELAAIGVDPGYFHIDNSDLDSKTVNLTFDVHGAPPYASSERDEADGFRIGWNNGYSIARVDEKWNADSVNMYNRYSRDVGSGRKENNTGSLRLTRNGPVFNAYYRDDWNREWVCSGSALVPSLSEDVFIRLAAKHWKKGGIPPANRVKFTHFRLYQF